MMKYLTDRTAQFFTKFLDSRDHLPANERTYDYAITEL